MKIAIISFRTFVHGGVERYAYELVNALSRMAEVHLFTHEVETGIKAKIHSIPAIGKKDLFSVNSFMEFLRRDLKPQQFDLIHSMGPLYPDPDLVTAHICQKRLLADSKQLFGDFSFLRKSYWAFRSKIASDYQRKSFRNARVVIAVSSMLAEEMRIEYGIDSVRVINPGISSDFYDRYDAQGKRRVRNDMKINQNCFLILFVGSQWHRKGLRLLIEAMRFLDEDCKLMVVGRGEKKKYRKLACKLGVEEKVLFQGFQKDIVKYYLAADVLVLPSLYEPFGYPVLEAMAMGLPVIVSNRVGAMELVEKGKTGFIFEDFSDAACIVEFIRDIQSIDASSFAEESRKKAQQFLWDKKIEEIVALYEGLFVEKTKDNKVST